MKKLTIALATIATLAVAAPTIASAEDINVRIGGHGDSYRDRGDYRRHGEFRGARAEFREHGWHRRWDHDRRPDRIVIIKKHRHHHWD